MKKLGIAVLAGLGLLLLVVLASVGRLGCNAHEQAQRVVEKTIDADNVIYNYEYFKDQYRAILAMDQKVQIAKDALDKFEKDAGPRKDWDLRDKEEHSRLVSNVTGTENMKKDMVAQYNANASKVNRNIFMGKDTPQRIEE